MLTRRALLASALALPAAARPKGVLIDAHIHLFAKDQGAFPFHPAAPYRPDPDASPQDLEDYLRFIAKAKIDHAIIVHPEPYQDDHRYLEHCFAHEPSPGFFKGTVLFDPIDPQTPARMRAIVKAQPNRIVAIRVHAAEPARPTARHVRPHQEPRSAQRCHEESLARRRGPRPGSADAHAAPSRRRARASSS